MKKNHLRVLALALAMALLLCAVPATFAQESDAAIVGGVGYATVAEAVANADGKVVKLLKDSKEQVTANGDLYLDLNGHCLDSLTMASGTLYGMDSTTDDYDCTGGYGMIRSLIGSYAGNYKTDITGAIRRYLTVEEDGIYSFHRIYLGLVYATIRPEGKGVGYKAIFAADSVAQSQLHSTEAFGYNLQLEGGQPLSVWKPASQFKSLKHVTLLVKDFDAEASGQTPLTATVQLKLKSGTVISTNPYSTDFKTVLETVNDTYLNYTEQQISLLADWIREVPVMMNWRTENIVPREDVTPEGLTIQAKTVTVDKGTGEVSMDIMVYNNPGIMTATITVEVDDTVIGFKRASKTEYPSLFLTAPGSKQTSSPYNFLLDGMELTDEDKVDGTLFTVTFKIKDLSATGKYEVKLSYYDGDITDENYEPLDVNMVNGYITIK